MCGIIGYIGKQTNIQKTLIDSLKTLEYRGYDSAGIAYVTDKVNIIKSKGKISYLEEKIDKDQKGMLGIAHTRWATHGEANDVNSHPHKVGSVTIVHNGIIENYMELKKLLEKEGYEFKSETDTEVACAVLDYLKNKKLWNNLEIIKEFSTYVKGSFALGIIFDDELDTLYATRCDSPLILGLGKDETLIASDIAAVIKFTKEYILLDNDDIVKLTQDKTEVYNKELELICKEKQTVNWNIEQAEKGGYEHFMLKEIHEEEEVLHNTINEYVDTMETFLQKMPDFTKYKKIHIVACGSAMHAGLIGKYLFENYSDIETTVEIASEYRYKKVFYNHNDTLVILISQSGETADTIACLRKAKENGIDTLAIVNVVSSTIAREADKVLYIRAGVEIAVATTKAYLLQVAMLMLVNLKMMAEKSKIDDIELKVILNAFKTSPKVVKQILAQEDKYLEIAKMIHKDEDIFFIGRGIDYAISMEGSLKLKEISYIHSEAYQAGELKHGTISLIEDHTKVISVMTDEDLYLKTISNIKEVKARGADVVLLTTPSLDNDYEFADRKIVLPETNKYLVPMLSIIPLQLIAYQVAKLRGCDIDKPRNLAKSVTVE
ncbi:MAG: glutamine--fructose-6-phosphate transaminase (isomerizing) [Firmicutes bacterium]|nr:glutamine--fructose-6-phosphate transaminase (isomerizing) [Bacillota bacterium]